MSNGDSGEERNGATSTGGDVAIVGMACLFPGAGSVRTFWQNIVDKVDAIGDPPADWGGQFSFDPESEDSDRIYCMRGGYLGDLSRFDPVDHGVMPLAVDGAEPEHFLALRVSTEALADAGFPDIPINKERTSVILGRGTFVNRALTSLHQHGFVLHQTLALLKELHSDYTDDQLAALKRKLQGKLPPLNAMTAAGVVSSITSGRVANRLDLHGPNYCVDAACASSLIAVEHAVRDLRLHRCDAAIAGGVQLSANNLVLMVFSQLGALSRQSRIRPFDAEADGTLLGEGVGAVVLKRREDALRDGNRIYALIKGVGSASDGRAKSIVAPRLEGEALALRRAYEDASVSPQTVGLIEAHGTSIRLGDATEVQTLTRVFGARLPESNRCAIGSVKSMIGHLIPASGIAGLIKVALSIYHKTLPPTLHCKTPDPDLKLDQSPFYVNTETRPWIHPFGGDAPRRAGVSAFGFGGINAHVVLEECVDAPNHEAESYHTAWDSELCIVTGSSRPELIQRVRCLHDFVSARADVALRDVAYSLSKRIDDGPFRLAMVCQNVDELVRKLAFSVKRLDDPSRTHIRDASGIYFFEDRLADQGKVAFLFPGEGSQYAGMLADLCLHFPEVRHCFDLMDRAFLEKGQRPLLSQILFPPPTCLTEADLEMQEQLLWDMAVGVQSVATANRALHKVLTRLHVRPDVVVGHSSGEFGALEAAGAIRLAEDQQTIQYILAGAKSVQGVSAAAEQLEEAVLVAASPDDPAIVERIVASGDSSLCIAMDNCPYQMVICASASAAHGVLDALRAAGVTCSTLPFRRPYHTAAFEPACGPLREFFAAQTIHPPRVPIYSCASTHLFPDQPDAIRALALSQWTLPVRFRETVERMYESGVRIFLEVGPRGNLSAFVNDVLRNRGALAVPMNLPHRTGITQLHHALGLLAAHGVDLQLEYLYARRAPVPLDLDLVPEEGPPDVQAEAPRLSLALPIIYLDQDDVAEVKGLNGPGGPLNLPTGAKGPSMTPTSTERRGNETTRPRQPEAPASEQVATTRQAGDFGHATQRTHDARTEDRKVDFHGPHTHAPVSAAPPRSAMMSQYLETMDQFLQSQRGVMTAYFRRPDRAANPAAGVSRTVPAKGSEREREGTVVLPGEVRGAVESLPDLPFAGRVERHIAGQELILRRDLSLTEDLYLKHHVLGGKVSTLDDTLEALPVMPLTMSMEMIGEAAICLMPGKVLVGMRDVRAHRWITLDDAHVALQLEATRAGDNEIRVEMREADSESSGNHRDHLCAPGPPIIEGIMILADAYAEAPPAGSFALRGAKPSRFTPDAMYATGMFNGPCFQAVHRVYQWGEDGSVATLKALPADQLFRSRPDPVFVADPVILDAAGQQAAHWNAESSRSGFNFFPYRFQELQIYAGPLRAPSTVESRLRIERLEPGRFRSDIDMVDADGRLRMRLIGWEDREFPLPKAFHGIRHGVAGLSIGRSWSPPLIGLSAVDETECCRVDEFSSGLLLGHGRIWLKVLARQLLSRTELAFWRTATMSDARRVQWLLGRAAAKEAVRRLLDRRQGINVCPADIEIETTASGRPVVLSGRIPGLRRLPDVSITHCGDCAVALAVDRDDVTAGIDVEQLRPIEDGFISMAFAPAERASLERCPQGSKNEWTLRLWCAKEAAAKAIGIGLQGNPKRLIVLECDFADGTVVVEGDSSAAHDDAQRRSEVVRVWTFLDGNTVGAATLRQRGVASIH